MGQAKRRGTFDERRKSALEKVVRGEIEREQRAENIAPDVAQVVKTVNGRHINGRRAFVIALAVAAGLCGCATAPGENLRACALIGRDNTATPEQVTRCEAKRNATFKKNAALSIIGAVAGAL